MPPAGGEPCLSSAIVCTSVRETHTIEDLEDNLAGVLLRDDPNCKALYLIRFVRLFRRVNLLCLEGRRESDRSHSHNRVWKGSRQLEVPWEVLRQHERAQQDQAE
jgi:hypothetical protein